MELGVGTAAGATDIAGQRAVLAAWRDSERTGDCPVGRASGPGDGVSGSDAPVFPSWEIHSRRSHSGLLLGLVHRFWTILCGIFAGFIVLEQLCPLLIHLEFAA